MKLLLANKHLHLLFIWFFPILVAASTGRLRNNYGIESSIVYLLAGSIGFGYFKYEESVKYVFNNSYLYDYYLSHGGLDQVSLVGIFNFIMKFGLIVSGVVTFLLYNAKKNAIDKKIYSISLIIVLASMVKNSHTVDYFVHLFFIFGLAWSCRTEIIPVKKSMKNIHQGRTV